MTSSLVGSEMCIRDSTLTHIFQALPPRAFPCAPELPCAHASLLLPELSLCLLYTSDAADDM
eukprot:7848640-Prorocentrum_lima.AAC.1